MVMSARVARGNIQPLDELKADNFDAATFPGGFGAAKNLWVNYDICEGYHQVGFP